jgi:hypothetical protein
MTLQKQSDIGHALKNIVAMDGVRGIRVFPPFPLLFCQMFLVINFSGVQAKKQGSTFVLQIHQNSCSFVVIIHGSAKFCLVDTIFERLLLRDCCFSCLI